MERKGFSVADARLALAMERAEQAGDWPTWLDTVHERYAQAADTKRLTPHLRELRRQLRQRVVDFRGCFRSRAGRLWGEQALDACLGRFLRDELNEGFPHAAAAFDAIEAGKARLLLDGLTTGFTELAAPEVRAATTELEREMMRFNAQPSRTLEDAELQLVSRLPIGLPMEWEKPAALLREIEATYRQHGAGFAGAAALPDLAAVQAALQPGEALIEYCLPFHPLHPALALCALWITADRTGYVRIPLDHMPEWRESGSIAVDGQQPIELSPLGMLIRNARVAIQRGDDVSAARRLASLHELLIAPIEADGCHPADFTRWIIVPQGPLHYVPFAALAGASGRPLIDSVALTIAPSAAVWLHLQRGPRPPVASFLGVGGPDLPRHRALAEAAQEITQVQRKLGALDCRTFTGPAATEENLRAHAAGRGIVHVATHGEFPEQDVLDFHRILLAASANHDGHLHAEELRTLDLRACRLATLSICNGGLYRFGPGDEPYGLMPAALVAGAENVVGTLWPLEDETARPFMIEFYRHVLAAGPAEALRRACRQFIADGALLSQWSGFVAVGPGRPIA
jgi:CHAT domain-containing protein